MRLKSAHTAIFFKKNGLLVFFTFIGLMAFAQPVANFSATPTSGCTPLAVSFIDQSTGTPTSWLWDLGNGTTSTQQNPTTTYFTPGTYTIVLTVTNAQGNNTMTKTQYIAVNDKPIVDFTASQTTGCFPLRVTFSDLSVPGSGSISAWEWDFGDGATSTQQNPFHQYSTAGNYTVTLKVTNSAGCFKIVSKPNYIQVSPGVTVNFSNTAPVLCHPPETINFTNTSTGPGTLSYQWFFGDGFNSFAINPSHTYNAGGSYTITLITQSSLGCVDTLIRPAAIVIKNVVPAFTGPDSICINTQAIFTNTSNPLPASATWDFGDGTATTGINATKTYTVPGNYVVKMVANFGSCSDSALKLVKALPLPLPNFRSPDSIDCKVPFTVNFIDMSTGAIAWQWNFGDGGTSTLQNPSHTYTTLGNYTVTLIITSSSGCTDSIIKTNFVRIQKPVVNINGVPAEGCVPYNFTPTPNITAIDGVASYLWDFGDGTTSTLQNPSHIYPTQGTYTVKLFVTTNDGCTDSSVVINAVRVGTLPSVDFSAAPLTQCLGQPIQFTDLSAPADRWFWNFGDNSFSTIQNPQHAYQDTGRFTITLIAWNNGCQDSVRKINLVTSLPPRSNFLVTYNCANKLQVSFTDQSLMPQTWFWDFGDGTTSTIQNPTHTYPAYGTYNATLTVTNGSCSHTNNFIVNLFNEAANFSVVDDTICMSQVAVFTPIVGNAANIATYYWDFGDGTAGFQNGNGSHSYTAPGLYTVTLTITDVRGCVSTISKPNIIRVWGPRANFTFNPPAGCKPLLVNFTDATVTDGVHAITNWFWDFNDGQTQNYSSPPFNHLFNTTGLFNPILTVTDSYGCTNSFQTATQVFVSFPVPQFSSSDTLTCIGQNVSFSNTSAGAGLTYLWKFGDGTTSTATNPLKTYNANGNYTITLIATDANGCVDSAVKNNYVKVQTTWASFTVNDSISSCQPFEVNFTNTSLFATSVQWSFGDGTSSTQVSPSHYYAVPGTYIVRLLTTGPGGCQDSAFKTIRVFSSNATISYTPLAGCSPLSVSFHVSTAGPVTYLWDLNDGSTLTTTDSNLVYSYIRPGNFIPKVILEDQTGCLIPVTGPDTIKVTKSIVKFGASDSLFCGSGSVNFTDSTTSNGIINGYNWNFGDGGTSTLQNPSHNYTAPGLYTVRLIVATANGCSDTLIKNNFIKVVAIPNADVNGTFAACEPASLTFNGVLLTPDTSALSWQWDFGNSNTSAVQNPPAQSYPAAGSYTLQLIVTNSTGCKDTVTKTITIQPLPLTNAGNDTTLCIGTPLQLNATGAAAYTWSPNSFLSCTNCANPVTTTPNNIRYYVTGATAFGCTTTDSIDITVERPFTFSVTPLADSLCIGQSIRLIANGSQNYIWTPAAGLSNANIANPVASPTISTIYKVVGYNSGICFKDSAYVNISVFAYPTVNAGPDKTIKGGTSLLLSPQYSNDITTWLWSPALGLSCSNCPYPLATPKENTTYTVRVTNDGGCSVFDNMTIFVTCGNENVFIPNTFSPNGDGVNDVFYPRGSGLFKIQGMRIFNRWGQMIFQKANMQPNDAAAGWNGKVNGQPAPSDSYVYLIEVICDNSTILTYKGNITIIQ